MLEIGIDRGWLKVAGFEFGLIGQNILGCDSSRWLVAEVEAAHDDVGFDLNRHCVRRTGWISALLGPGLNNTEDRRCTEGSSRSEDKIIRHRHWSCESFHQLTSNLLPRKLANACFRW